jgi:HAD superfamily hydrolase (TIGR01458 family)
MTYKMLDFRPKALLIDIDGTLIVKSSPVPGAVQAIEQLRRHRIGLRLLSNLTLRTPAMLARELQGYGFPVEEADILTAPVLCRRFLDRQPFRSCFLMIADETRPLFRGIPEDSAAPDFVVLGDYGDKFSFDSLNKAFRMLNSGAQLLALNRNAHWNGPSGPQLDCGSFVTLLEYAAGQKARIFGKPNPEMFLLAIESLGAGAADTLVVGDDVTTDFEGAHALNLACVLVETGKFRRESAPLPGEARVTVLPSIASLPALLGLEDAHPARP